MGAGHMQGSWGPTTPGPSDGGSPGRHADASLGGRAAAAGAAGQGWAPADRGWAGGAWGARRPAGRPAPASAPWAWAGPAGTATGRGLPREGLKSFHSMHRQGIAMVSGPNRRRACEGWASQAAAAATAAGSPEYGPAKSTPLNRTVAWCRLAGGTWGIGCDCWWCCWGGGC